MLPNGFKPNLAVSSDKEDDFKIYLFDKYMPDTPWCSRMIALESSKTYLPVWLLWNQVRPTFYIVVSKD